MADFDAVVGGEVLVELDDVIPERHDIARESFLWQCHHGTVPERVVVGDDATHPHELHRPRVVVDVVFLVSVNVDEVKGPLLAFLQGPKFRGSFISAHINDPCMPIQTGEEMDPTKWLAQMPYLLHQFIKDG